MYSGLFGDLPAAKDAKNADDDAKLPKKSDTGELATATADSQKAKQETSLKNPKGAVPSSTKKHTMAFIPAAVRKRPHKVKSVAVPAATAIQAASVSATPATRAPSTAALSSGLVEILTSRALARVDSTAASATLSRLPVPNAMATTSAAAENTLIGNNDRRKEETVHTVEIESFSSATATTTIIDDPYDPAVPNDVWQYWDFQAAARERQKLEKEHVQRLAQQEALRQQAARERQALLHGNDTSALAAYQARASGRGRGISNLPAWMKAPQQSESRPTGGQWAGREL
jgi:hypothetical protein